MIEHALLYCLRGAPDLHGILEAAGLGSAAPPPPANGEPPTRMSVSVMDMNVELIVLPAKDVRAHLEGLPKFLEERCEVHDPSILDIAQRWRGIVAITLDPGYSPSSTEFLRMLARANAAQLFFAANGSIQDGEGHCFSEPMRIAMEPVDDDEPATEEAEEAPDPEYARVERVARRALILAGLAWRSWLEAARPQDAGNQRERFIAWLEQNDLFSDMEGAEATLARSELGSWTAPELRIYAWGIEGAGLLAWALGLFELPPHDVRVEPPAVGQALGLFAEEPAAFDASLRDDAELAAMSARLLGIHWRLREFDRAPADFDFEAFAKSAWFGGFDLQGIPVVNKDLAVVGQPVPQAPEKAVQIANSISVERYRAIAWLLGKEEERLAAR